MGLDLQSMLFDYLTSLKQKTNAVALREFAQKISPRSTNWRTAQGTMVDLVCCKYCDSESELCPFILKEILAI